MLQLYGKLSKTVEALKMYGGTNTPTAETNVDNISSMISVDVKKVPNALTLTQGDTAVTYDGSSAVSISIPTSTALSEMQQAVASLQESVGQLVTDLNSKQDKNVKFTNTTVPSESWVIDDTYPAYPYKATVYFNDITTSMTCFMQLSIEDALSNNYVSQPQVISGGISIWAKSNSELIIPTILFIK